jgi:hypothetical protein
MKQSNDNRNLGSEDELLTVKQGEAGQRIYGMRGAGYITRRGCTENIWACEALDREYMGMRGAGQRIYGHARRWTENIWACEALDREYMGMRGAGQRIYGHARRWIHTIPPNIVAERL